MSWNNHTAHHVGQNYHVAGVTELDKGEFAKICGLLMSTDSFRRLSRLRHHFQLRRILLLLVTRKRVVFCLMID
jgi:hypothetical protein